MRIAMNLTRREALALGAGVVLAGGVRAAEPKKRLGVVLYSYSIRHSHPPKGEGPSLDDPRDFLDHCAIVGAAGIQTALGARDEKYAETLRAKAEKHGMYVEGIVGLPKNKDDVTRFEKELRFAKECGATVLRTAAMNGRRYEKFETREAFDAALKAASESLALAAPVAEKLKVRLGVENHKDLRIPDMLEFLKRFDREQIGICLDTGNSIALLEQPLDVVKAFAGRTITTHLKDMAVAEYEDGFLLSEVALGDGSLDLKQIVKLIDEKSQGAVRWNLEMITRDPLRVPCLTPKYWATMGDLPARRLAEALARVRKEKQAELPSVSKLTIAKQIEEEEDNVRRSFKYAREKLEL
jgi:sugar phosphate isomerase/epimerase